MSIGGQSPGTARKAPVWRTAVDSFRFVFSNLDRFLALGWLPLVIAFAVNMVSDVRGEVGGGEDASVADWVAYVALSAAYWAMYAVFAVRWHRFYLLDERESVFSEFLAARNWRFLGYTLLLTFAPMVPMWVFVLISGFVSILPSIAASILLFVMFRFSLVLPGTAVDRPLGLGEAWHKMLGHTWRFIGAFFLVAILYMILFWIVSAIFGQTLSGGITSGAPEPTIGTLFATNAAMEIFGFFATAAGITVLSKFYRHIVGGEIGEGGPAAGP
ncbi:MAG: hypothetical protein IH904_08465 [Proteobacteria bacterium]|nr:hypothetical protein [Pseudomonadota bacterium]